MLMKTINIILGVLFVLPGFIFDTCFGIAFLVNDGRSDKHDGDFIALWAFDAANSIPEFLQLPFFISVLAGALPAGVVCIGLFLGLLFLAVYILNGIIGSVLQLPFTGKIRWVTLTSLTDA